MKCKQVVSQDKSVKQWKAIRKPIANTSNLFRGSSHRSTSPPSPPWRISTKSTKEFTRGLHKTGVPNSHQSNPLHKRDLNIKRIQVTRWSKRTTNFSLTTPYRMGKIFDSRSEVRKFSCKEVRKSLKTTEKLKPRMHLGSESFENFSFLFGTQNNGNFSWI